MIEVQYFYRSTEALLVKIILQKIGYLKTNFWKKLVGQMPHLPLLLRRLCLLKNSKSGGDELGKVGRRL